WRANRQQLESAGVPGESIETAAMCTICDTRFWSHRRDGETAGRSALFVAIGQ
ncbi:MAG TPA: laccase domain-containing protein, partial [Phycisphaerae bacterium]|nr:laccase domain-containing protein [Phycisphaerae bacterium]